MTALVNSQKVYINENTLTIEAYKGEDISVFLKVYERLNKYNPVDLANYDLEVYAESLYRERRPDINMSVTHVADTDFNNVVHVTLTGSESMDYVFETRAYFFIYGVHKVSGLRTVLLNGMINFLN